VASLVSKKGGFNLLVSFCLFEKALETFQFYTDRTNNSYVKSFSIFFEKLSALEMVIVL
jgi:hypothetical protein